MINKVTNGVMDEVKAWQNRTLDEVYPIIFLDCIVVKCRQDGKVANMSVYLALGVNMAEIALEEFAEKWDGKYPMISKTVNINYFSQEILSLNIDQFSGARPIQRVCYQGTS